GPMAMSFSVVRKNIVPSDIAGRGQADAAQLVGGEHAEMLFRRQHEHVSLFTGEIDFAMSADRRSGESVPATGDSLAVIDLSRFRVEGSDDSIEIGKNEAAHGNGCF